MKLWTLRQEWNEKEYNREFNSLISSQIKGDIEYEEMARKLSLLPKYTKNTTEYIIHLGDFSDYKLFCQKAKEIMRCMPKGRYEVIYKQEESNETLFNDRVRNYLYATLNTDEVIS